MKPTNTKITNRKLIYLVNLFSISFLFVLNNYAQNVSLESFATGFDNPTAIEHAGDSRLFVLEKGGLIKILNSDASVNTTPFLDIDAMVLSGGERGLLGIAFHPNYATNGYFYVNYTNNSGDTVIARFTVTADPDIADASSKLEIISIEQPYSNHNGGSVVFGPDGYLYIGMGDGGSGEDPHDNSQNPLAMLGKMLRIDVDGGSPYAIPSDNPFVGNASYHEEIWALGLRNPWKYSFDTLTGDLWIADVGQYEIEEIDKVANTEAGINYGWRCYEGTDEFNTTGCGSSSEYTFPVAQYTHTGGRCSITGGYVYRGTSFSSYTGLYFFADYCSSEIGTVDPNNAYQITYHGPFAGNFATFGQDVAGELYIAGISNGTIYKIHDATVSISENLIEHFVISPNPAHDFVSIRSKTNQLEGFTIYKYSGVIVMKGASQNTSSFKINISNIPTGIYMLELRDKGLKKSYTKLIIK